MDADDLFGLPLDEFIPERTALVKSLRSEKRRDEANEVAAIRKPSVAAWAVNQLVRTHERAVDKLFEAGDALRAAQDEVLAGKGDRQGLRAAVERERQAVDELIKAARGLLSAEGDELSPAVIERVGETLHAAALDEDARRQVADGRLQRELQHVGFGPGVAFGGAGSTGGATAAKTGTRAKSTPKDAEPKHEAQRVERKRAQRERAAAVKAARTAEGDTRRVAARAQRALELAQERRDRAAEALTEAEHELEQAQAEAQEAADAHRSASEQLEQLRE